ncbi:hypothetical protein PtB15_14B31 [Puccinia triticina]|nr:hypothetical protein PtB15_14B31 [Puccinia triticina]
MVFNPLKLAIANSPRRLALNRFNLIINNDKNFPAGPGTHRWTIMSKMSSRMAPPPKSGPTKKTVLSDLRKVSGKCNWLSDDVSQYAVEPGELIVFDLFNLWAPP